MGKPKGESRGLDYLTRVRPLAMDHLLKFFKESGKHLEPKTRFLISVVTKVINFSPRGLEQYVKRALKEGASPHEVIDAVLCSYPCAGLTKVVDAIDVILDMRLPGFDEEELSKALGKDREKGSKEEEPEEPEEPEESPDDPEEPPDDPGEPRAPSAARGAPVARWVCVARLEELPPGEALHIQAGRFDLALFNVRGSVLAINQRCPHRAGPLAMGQVSDMVVTCPLHGWKFHLGSGVSVDHPGAQVATYSTRIGGDNKIEVLLPP